MTPNQPHWPREWLMTDERLGDRLWDAVAALPAGAGVVFRHYHTPTRQRAQIGRRLASSCAERGLLLAVAQDGRLARSLGAGLVHNPATDQVGLPFSRPAHDWTEARQAWAAGAALIFLSPIFATRSHPGREPLAREEALRIAAASPVPVIALGGMNRARFEQSKDDGFYGWAGIDAWLGVSG